MPIAKTPKVTKVKASVPSAEIKRELPAEQRQEVLSVLKARFAKNLKRHPGLEWDAVQTRLASHPEKLRSLHEMESTGGEPDVIGLDAKTGEYIFCDCAPESPKDRRSACYDREGQMSREKEGLHPGSMMDMAAAMGIEPLTEEEYRELQELGEFDLKTQSWLKTPSAIRALGGAIFGDRRFGRVFVYHNTARSFYSSRGFRGRLRV